VGRGTKQLLKMTLARADAKAEYNEELIQNAGNSKQWFARVNLRLAPR
jgi:hypothetical protein